MDICVCCRIRMLVATAVVVMVTIISPGCRGRVIHNTRQSPPPDARQWYRDFMKNSVRDRVAVGGSWVPKTSASTDRHGLSAQPPPGDSGLMNDAGPHGNGNHGNAKDPRINDKGQMTDQAMDEVIGETDFTGYVCRPRPQVVDIRRPRTMNISAVFFPTCVSVNRCGGCCMEGSKCRPTVHVYKTVTLKVYDRYPGGEKYLPPYSQKVKVKSHTFCACQNGPYRTDRLRGGRGRSKHRRPRNRKSKRGKKNQG